MAPTSRKRPSLQDDERSPTPTPPPKRPQRLPMSLQKAINTPDETGRELYEAEHGMGPRPCGRLAAIQDALDECAREQREGLGSLRGGATDATGVNEPPTNPLTPNEEEIQKDRKGIANANDGARADGTSHTTGREGLEIAAETSDDNNNGAAVELELETGLTRAIDWAAYFPERTGHEDQTGDAAEMSTASPGLTNLSYHGGSVASSDVGLIIGDHLCQGGRLEDIVTDRIDRYGRPLPGYEDQQEQEQERQRKRTRTEGEPAQEPPQQVIRFRKYKDLPTPRTKARRAEERRTARESAVPETNIGAPLLPFQSAAELHRAWLLSTATAMENAPLPPTPALPPLEDRLLRMPSPMRLPPPPSLLSRTNGAEATGNTVGNQARAESRTDELREMEVDPQPALYHASRQTTPDPWSQLLITPTRARTRGAPTPLKPSALEAGEIDGRTTGPKTEGDGEQNTVAPEDEWDANPWPTAPLGGQLKPTMKPMSKYDFMPTPEGGFPEIHHAHPEALLRDMSPDRIKDIWEDGSEDCLLLTVFNTGFPGPGLAAPMTKTVKEVVTDFIRAEGVGSAGEDIVVVAPEPVWMPNIGKRGSPLTWVLYGLDKTAKQRAIAKRVLSCEEITVLVHEREIYLPRYLVTLVGFIQDVKNDIENTITKAFRSDRVKRKIGELVRANPEFRRKYKTPAEAIEAVTASVDYRVDELDNGNLHVAVFCDPPAVDMAAWSEWRSFILATPFPAKFNPPGEARILEPCAGCHGADHVAHKCPLVRAAGWKGPKAGDGVFGTADPRATRGGVPQHGTNRQYAGQQPLARTGDPAPQGGPASPRPRFAGGQAVYNGRSAPVGPPVQQMQWQRPPPRTSRGRGAAPGQAGRGGRSANLGEAWGAEGLQ
ncbi:hypothetical protein C2E23DRAFT_886417 [Lenzites betulinus]|nr:hypothetical protein C2E23DRAFT_886417 [Lenzites betulinus]